MRPNQWSEAAQSSPCKWWFSVLHQVISSGVEKLQQSDVAQISPSGGLYRVVRKVITTSNHLTNNLTHQLDCSKLFLNTFWIVLNFYL